jgi:hypothetical protein
MGEPKKKQASKPSERIQEIIEENPRLALEHSDRIDAIIQYLDERWERSQRRQKQENPRLETINTFQHLDELWEPQKRQKKQRTDK